MNVLAFKHLLMETLQYVNSSLNFEATPTLCLSIREDFTALASPRNKVFFYFSLLCSEGLNYAKGTSPFARFKAYLITSYIHMIQNKLNIKEIIMVGRTTAIRHVELRKRTQRAGNTLVFADPES